jgi:hypothetical protein
MSRIYAYAAVALGACLLLAAAAHSLYQAGKEAGANACKAAHARAAEKAGAEVQRREAASAEASVDMLAYLSANLPAIEIRTHETVERVRTEYRDRPAPAGCVRPDGVLDALEASRQRANAAAR